MKNDKIDKIAQLKNDIRQFEEAIQESDDLRDTQSLVNELDSLLVELADLEIQSDQVVIAA